MKVLGVARVSCIVNFLTETSGFKRSLHLWAGIVFLLFSGIVNADPTVELEILNTPNDNGNVVVIEGQDVEVSFDVTLDSSDLLNKKDKLELILATDGTVLASKQRGAALTGSISLTVPNGVADILFVQYVRNDTGEAIAFAGDPDDPGAVPLIAMLEANLEDLSQRVAALENANINTVQVKPIGPADTDNGDLLRATVEGVTDSAEDNPYLILLEPGVYDIGSSAALDLPPYVGIRGAGVNLSTIVGGVSGGFVIGAGGGSSLESLTIEHAVVTNSIPQAAVYVTDNGTGESLVVNRVAIDTSNYIQSGGNPIGNGLKTDGSGASAKLLDVEIIGSNVGLLAVNSVINATNVSAEGQSTGITASNATISLFNVLTTQISAASSATISGRSVVATSLNPTGSPAGQIILADSQVGGVEVGDAESTNEAQTLSTDGVFLTLSDVDGVGGGVIPLPQGPTGPQGPIGLTGATGSTGPVGPQGPAGADGATGATGPQGPAGPVGATGPQGPTGLTGPAGPAGPPGVVSFGASNTKGGTVALSANTTGSFNSAYGVGALANNTTGSLNTANGHNALFTNTTGNLNTASGSRALALNTTGTSNTAVGFQTLRANTIGGANTAIGQGALENNTTGNFNTASGTNALRNITGGMGNISIGSESGVNLTSGNNNIYIDNPGTANESGTVRIGRNFQNRTFIAGIQGVDLSADPTAMQVVVTSQGQLGIGPGVAGPAGPQGPEGPQGPQGIQGPAGIPGATGATGPQGADGVAGADGETGPQGPVGPQGPAGADGVDGATGPQGPVGPQGPAGADGADGGAGLKTILVSPIGPTEIDNGTALMTAVDGITDSSASNPYLINLEPGVYDIGALDALDLPPYVGIRGAGINLTTIVGRGTNPFSSNATFNGGFVIVAGDGSSLESLTVRHIGETNSTPQGAIYVIDLGGGVSFTATRVVIDTSQFVQPNSNKFGVGIRTSGANASADLLDVSVTGSDLALVQQGSSQIEGINVRADGDISASVGSLNLVNTQVTGSVFGVPKCVNSYDSAFLPLGPACL